MKPFRLVRRRHPGAAPGRRARAAAPGRRWLTAVAGTCLATVLAGWPVMLAGNAPPGPGVSVVLTAMQRPQARVLNPGPPTGLTATAGNGQVTLSWQAPTSDGGAAIIGYDVYLGTSSHGESASPVNGGLITGTGYTLTGLKNGTTYYVTADAVNDANLHSAASGRGLGHPGGPGHGTRSALPG